MKNNKKMSAGITLIALVVTIIVLLILAGISITMLSGENGILVRAGKAKKDTDYAEFMEQLQLAVVSNMKNSKNLDINTLNSYIKSNISGVTTDDATSWPLTVTYSATGDSYEISEDWRRRFTFVYLIP